MDIKFKDSYLTLVHSLEQRRLLEKILEAKAKAEKETALFIQEMIERYEGYSLYKHIEFYAQDIPINIRKATILQALSTGMSLQVKVDKGAFASLFKSMPFETKEELTNQFNKIIKSVQTANLHEAIAPIIINAHKQQ